MMTEGGDGRPRRSPMLQAFAPTRHQTRHPARAAPARRPCVCGGALRAVDTSASPSTTCGDADAAAIMTGARGAAFVLEDAR